MRIQATQLISDMSVMERGIKYILIPLITIPFRLLCLLIPKNNSLWVFGCHAGQVFNGNSKSFYDYVQTNEKSITAVIITHNLNTYAYLRKIGHRVYIAYSLRGIWAVARARLAFITNFAKDDLNYLSVSNRLILINLWHGVPIKDIRWPKSRLHQLAFSIINWQIPKPAYFVSTYNQPINHTPQEFSLTAKQILPLGYPRNDQLFTPPQRSLSNLIGASLSNTNIALFAPTFRLTKFQPFTHSQLILLNDIAKKNSTLILFKAHPLIPMPDLSQFNRLIDITKKVEDIQPLLKEIDILITDYSSVCIDFALLNKPIIFYPFDYDEYSSSEGFAMNYFKDLPGPFALNFDSLLTLLTTSSIWFNEKTYRKKFTAFINHFHQNKDGKSSKRLLHFISDKFMNK